MIFGEWKAVLLCLCAAAPGWLLWLYTYSQNVRLRAEKSQLAQEADLDPLTGAFHYRVLRRALSTRTVPPQGCIFCDLNNLKITNDTCGHMEGDRLIRAAAEAIRTATEGRGWLFRIGGDEFLYLPDEAAPSIPELCRRIDNAVATRNTWFEIPLLMAVGGAVPSPGEDWKRLIEVAEQEMYRDKKQKKQAHFPQEKGGNLNT